MTFKKEGKVLIKVLRPQKPYGVHALQKDDDRRWWHFRGGHLKISCSKIVCLWSFISKVAVFETLFLVMCLKG